MSIRAPKPGKKYAVGKLKDRSSLRAGSTKSKARKLQGIITFDKISQEALKAAYSDEVIAEKDAVGRVMA